MNTFETKLKGLPNRTDKKYMEIESFEAYELLPCVCYEAAIRNADVNTELQTFHKNVNKLVPEVHQKKYLENTFENKLSTLHQHTILNTLGFNLDAAMFFVLKQKDSNHQIQNKVLTSHPNELEIDKNGDTIHIYKNKDGSITRRCLNQERVRFEQFLRLKARKREQVDKKNKDFFSLNPIPYKEEEFQKFCEQGEEVLREFIYDEESLKTFEKICEFRALRQSLNWVEFNSAPIFNLVLSMQRPIIKRKVMHPYLALTLNFNLPINELMEQLKVSKEIYDRYAEEKKETDTKYLQSHNINFSDKVRASVIPSVYLHKNLLTAGELGCTNNAFVSTTGKRAQEDIEYKVIFRNPSEFNSKKHHKAKIYADIFYTYDCMKLIEHYNKKQGKKLVQEIKNIKEMGYAEEEIEYAKEDFKSITKSEAFTHIYYLINKKRSKNSTTINSHWKYAQELIDEGMYKGLM